MAEEGSSLRDQMKDMIRGYLADYHHVAESEVDYDMVCDLVDVVFDVMRIPENKQDYPYKEYVTIIEPTLERGEW